jgi:hypothetical protein
MQGGQWEYAVVPENGGNTMYFGINLPTTSAAFNASNVAIFQPSEITLTQNTGPIVCQGYFISGIIKGMKIDVQFDTGTNTDFASFSGQLSSNGQAISDGKYSGQNCSLGNEHVSGTLTGYTVPPLNGTFKGTLTSNLFGSDIMTVAFTQHPDFSVNAMGTLVENGMTTSFVNVAGSSDIVGGAVFFGANTVNVNGNGSFDVLGHLNPAATQLTLYLTSANDETAIGTLTKQ